MIVGKDMPLIDQILRVLTYFIRCSELAENTEMCPLLTADVDDTATLMSASDSVTPVSCLAVDVTLSSSETSVKSASPVSGQKSHFTASSSSPRFVLKPAPSSIGRGIHVHFQNGNSGTSECVINTSKSSGQSTVVSDCTASSASVETSPTVSEHLAALKTDDQPVLKPHLWFRSDVCEVLPPLLGATCSGCSYSQSCKECSENTRHCKLQDLPRSDNNASLASTCTSSLCTVSDMPSDTRASTMVERTLPPCDSTKLCQLSPVEANENVRIERVAHVGRDQMEESQPKLWRVPLAKPSVTSPDSCRGSRKSPVLVPNEHSPVRSSELRHYQRSNSMFDEYFDGSSSCPVIDLCVGVEGMFTFTYAVDDNSTFDEIMNEPCPDVSHIDVHQLSSSSSLSEVVPQPLLDSDNTAPQSSRLSEMVPDSTQISLSPSSPASFDNVFAERHFSIKTSDEHLDDIPDGPSKQMISSTIKLVQDLCSERTSQASVDDLTDVPVSDYFSQTGLGLSRGRQRYPSGQSNTSTHCR